LLLWDVQTGKPLFRLGGHKERVRFLAFSPDSRTLYTVDYDNVLLTWDATTGRERRRRAGDKNAVLQSVLSPDGKLLAWTGRKDEILFLNAATGEEVRKVKEPRGRLARLALAPDGLSLLAWSYDKHLLRWEIATGQRHETPCEGLSDSPFTVVFSPDRTLIAFGGQRGDLILASVATGREVRRLAEKSDRGDENGVFHLAFSPDGRTLAWAGPKDGLIRLSEVATGKERRRLVGHRGRFRALAFSPTGTQLISGGDDTAALVWDLTGPISWGTEPPGPLSAAVLAACWDELQSEDAGQAYLAMRRFIADPARAAPSLGQRLGPALPVDEKRVARLLADLDSEEFVARDEATRELEKAGEVALPALRKLLAANPSLETRRRIEKLTEKLETLSPERLRAIRTVEALEYMATPEAQQVLQGLAKGAPGPRQTEEAKASLGRLAKRTAAGT
jgi:Tol biopolymer transport system component